MEGRVRFNKRLIATATNGFSNKSGNCSVTYQELTSSWRQDRDRIENPPARKRQCTAKSWAARMLVNVSEQSLPVLGEGEPAPLPPIRFRDETPVQKQARAPREV